MADKTQISELRGLIQEQENAEPWTDDYLGALIDRYGVRRSALSIWKQKSASYVEIVSTSEGGSSRSNSDIHRNALEQIKMLGDDDDGEDVKVRRVSRTRAAVRRA